MKKYPSFPRKRGEAGFSRTYLTYVRAAERVQRVWLHPGQQQAVNVIARNARDTMQTLDARFRGHDNF
jgi:hypothetical protein